MKQERTEKVEHLDGRADIVHRHFKDLFTTNLMLSYLSGIEQQWPYEIILALPMMVHVSVKLRLSFGHALRAQRIRL